jgi:CRP-like cAMP-binding protein
MYTLYSLAFLSLPPPLTRKAAEHSLSKAKRRCHGLGPMTKKRVSPLRPSVRPPPADERPNNRLLAALPADDFRRLQPYLKTIPIRLKQVLHKNGEPLRAVYFLNGGVASITTVLSDGTTVEAATVGDEGMLGVEVFLDAAAIAAGETLIQVPDTSAETMSVEDFRNAVGEPGAFRDLVGRYTHVVIAQMMQSAACNALHHVQQRCARWLLMTHDRMHEQDFHLSHEFLAVMLGVQRPTVSVVAGTLQQAGLIRYMHGRVTVRDRKGLEAASCECYTIVRAHFDRLRQ